jgi:N-acetylglucosamine malate deacetylase 1
MATVRTAIAIAAHPDDIEFSMAGTLLLLCEAGWEIHYLNLASGNCGSSQYSAARTRVVRAREARASARLLGAQYHPSYLDDLEIVYDSRTLQRLTAIIREVQPTVILTHSPQDYMEDHMNTSRLVVTAAFARGMPNYRTRPPRRVTDQPVTIYHAMPHGLRDSLRQRIVPGAFVNTTPVHATKRAALACHRSQKEWLDRSQGMDSYLRAMDEMSRAVGKLSGRFPHAEGWRRHSHLGFSPDEADSLGEALRGEYLVNRRYERALNRE